MNFKIPNLTCICVATFLSALPAYADSQTIQFNEDNWMLIGAAKFLELDGRDALQLGMSNQENPVTFGAAVLKAAPFENGVIEYDIKFDKTRTFTGIQFRVAGQGEAENFYIRPHKSGLPDANQYMTNYNGIPSWQLYYGTPYSSPTTYAYNEWISVKYVIQDGFADIYIGAQDSPELTIALKREQSMGGIGLWGIDFSGPSWVSNFSIHGDSAEAVVGIPAPEPKGDAGTVTSWQVSNAVDSTVLANATEIGDEYLSQLSFTKMDTEASGMLNLAKLQGVAKGADTAIAKIVISSESEQIKAFDFGFSDDVSVFLNSKRIFSGSDRFASRDYRFLGTVGYNDSVWLPLEKGENTLILSITEDVVDTTGWAIQGRFRDMSGISVK